MLSASGSIETEPSRCRHRRSSCGASGRLLAVTFIDVPVPFAGSVSPAPIVTGGLRQRDNQVFAGIEGDPTVATDRESAGGYLGHAERRSRGYRGWERCATAQRGAELSGAARWYSGEPEMAAFLDHDVRAGHSWSERRPLELLAWAARHAVPVFGAPRFLTVFFGQWRGRILAPARFAHCCAVGQSAGGCGKATSLLPKSRRHAFHSRFLPEGFCGSQRLIIPCRKWNPKVFL